MAAAVTRRDWRLVAVKDRRRRAWFGWGRFGMAANAIGRSTRRAFPSVAAAPPRNVQRILRLTVVALTAVGAALWLSLISIRALDPGIDVHAYFVGAYGALGGHDAYLYSP